MKILRTVAELRAFRRGVSDVGFVPTMGALHEGHLSLVRLSRASRAVTGVSLFVNPLQFGKNEDLSRYPRPFERDCELLEKEGVDFLFAPAEREVYPEGPSTVVLEESVSQPLCGATRPGHFRGVTTVVAKLFNLVQPDAAFFGQKDYQQCVVIERMVRDLNFPVQIIRGATVREPDGLALSSRNAFLSAEEREVAPLIHRSLRAAAYAFAGGERDARKLEQIGLNALRAAPLFQPQYWEVRHPGTLAPLEQVGPEGAVFAVATFLGKTRLIDNLLI